MIAENICRDGRREISFAVFHRGDTAWRCLLIFRIRRFFRDRGKFSPDSEKSRKMQDRKDGQISLSGVHFNTVR